MKTQWFSQRWPRNSDAWGWDEDQDIVIDTEHASREVDPEEDGVVPANGEAVASVDEGLNSWLGRILPKQEEKENEEEEEPNNNELSMPKRILKHHEDFLFWPSSGCLTQVFLLPPHWLTRCVMVQIWLFKYVAHEIKPRETKSQPDYPWKK